MLNRLSATHPSVHKYSLIRVLTIPKQELKSGCIGLDLLKRTWLGLSTRLQKSIWSIFWRLHLSYTGKKEKDYFHYRKGCRNYRHFAYMQIRRIPAVTHIKILFVEHAQTKCLYAFPYTFETMLGIIPDQWKSLSNFCPYKETLKARPSRSPRVNLSRNKPVQNGVSSEEAVGHENKKDFCVGKSIERGSCTWKSLWWVGRSLQGLSGFL